MGRTSTLSTLISSRTAPQWTRCSTRKARASTTPPTRTETCAGTSRSSSSTRKGAPSSATTPTSNPLRSARTSQTFCRSQSSSIPWIFSRFGVLHLQSYQGRITLSQPLPHLFLFFFFSLREEGARVCVGKKSE